MNFRRAQKWLDKLRTAIARKLVSSDHCVVPLPEQLDNHMVPGYMSGISRSVGACEKDDTPAPGV